MHELLDELCVVKLLDELISPIQFVQAS